MKSYLVFSCAAHGFLVGFLVVVGTLLTKPRMSYYAVDLMGAPAGGGAVSASPVSPVSAPPTPAPAPVKVKSAPPAPVARGAEEELPDQDTMRMLAKLKKKRIAVSKGLPQAEESESRARDSSSGGGSPAQGHGSGGPGGAGAGIVAEAGTAFPYPWYLKTIADKLDKQWRPPQEFQPETICQVTFVIGRSGQISGSQISKSSGDSMFDQLALRAVLYSNPLPPLPNGFPDDVLKVHMKFVGKRQ